MGTTEWIIKSYIVKLNTKLRKHFILCRNLKTDASHEDRPNMWVFIFNWTNRLKKQ